MPVIHKIASTDAIERKNMRGKAQHTFCDVFAINSMKDREAKISIKV
jgi:hypothetical protein